ncbi:3-dehydroquinate synthase [Parachlamydia sp. AcF125]|uniref:3-dehydroquinate synthase n=1 Tax=Parachlamydia sp. AcF125 TaxID=2795736 RepID=UPI001BC9802F|nr:3-dehydroquinate synthase [Parachlamydia sp. AcF125]MBS4168956.1 3-dehydroquinate synthase [Parachlamydia sp. AcF125]
MTYQLTCSIPASQIHYEIKIGRHILNDLSKFLKPFGHKFALIADTITGPLYGEKIKEMLLKEGLEASLFTFPSGEAYKTRATKENLENQLFEKGLGRDTCLLAVGGGVVTDLAGFIAATYCRGIPLVMLPTTLLGMVDASIGGKTGVNTPRGKNLVGCIYQPQLVIMDVSTLGSLSREEIKNGAVEMIKHGLIADASYFSYLALHSDRLLALESAILQKAIYESCRIKKEMVEQDEKERGKRHLLNFGHTIGHALEHLTHYELSHGEAVAIGILVESYLALIKGCLSQHSFDQIRDILRKYALPLRLPRRISYEALFQAMILDKKSCHGKPRFVMLQEIGDPFIPHSNYCVPIEDELIKQAVEWMDHALCGN